MMDQSYQPNFNHLDNEEAELENLSRRTAVSDTVREAILEPYRTNVRKNVTMRLSTSVIEGLKSKAEQEGIPYQTLASMILQKYIRGAFLDRDAVLEIVQALKTTH